MAARKKATVKPRRRSPRKKKSAWKPVLAGVAGGLGTAGVGYLLVRSGVSPMTTAVGLTAAGGVAALTSKGNYQAAAIGASGMGCGQLGLALIANQASQSAGKDDKDKQLAAAAPKKPERQSAFVDDIESAFERAREQLSMEDEEAAFTEDYEEAAA